MHLVQIANGPERRVALVSEPHLLCLRETESVYELARECLRGERSLRAEILSKATGEVLSYNDIYLGNSPWRLLPPIDIPGQPRRMLVSGTGLTHVGSARQRQAMHIAGSNKESDEALTDSMRMFRWGIEGGRPAAGEVGIPPEWFYKGDGSYLRGPFEPLEIPFHAEDGGEEAEIAGVYMIAADGTPYRIGFAQGNEFSDHKFEKRNYLNLAASKLHTCSIGPELVIDNDFQEVLGEVRIHRNGTLLWRKSIASGEANMCHSLANIEHHHFKFSGHRQPDAVHVHFFGADSLSFGEGIILEDGDVMEVAFESFGRALQNRVRRELPIRAALRVIPLT